MHIIGIVIFLIAGLLLVALTVLRAARDQGVRERRALSPQGLAIWQWFARFEQRGGRVQDLEGFDLSTTLRARSLGWKASSQLIVALVAAAVAFAFGWAWWIPLAITLILIVIVGYSAEYQAYLSNSEVEDWKYESAKVALALGLVLKGVALCAGVGALFAGASFAAAGSWLPALALALVGVAVIDRAHLPARLVESWIRRRSRTDFAESTADDAILYLRSFDDDAQSIYSPLASIGWYAPFLPQRARFEELVEAWTFSNAAQVVAIGRPGERRPTLGAQRTYWTDETWQEAVRHTAARCRAIILVAGTSEGLGWEIAQLAQLDVLGKTLLLLPLDTPAHTRDRYERIAALADTHRDVLVDDTLALQSIPALGFTPDGQLVHYVSFGRDWASFVIAESHMMNSLAGTGRFEATGNLSQMFAFTDDPLLQARYLVQQEGDHERARALVAEAERAQSEAPDTVDPVELQRLLVARAAVDLAAGDPPLDVRERFLTAHSGTEAGDTDMKKGALAMLDSSAASADDLFALLLPPQMVPEALPRPRERVPVLRASAFARLLTQTELSTAAGQYSLAWEQARAAREMAVGADLELSVALADLAIAESLVGLDRPDDAREVALDVISRDLPVSVKLMAITVEAAEVKDRAVALLLSLAANDRAERVRLRGLQHAWLSAAGHRKEAADTAQVLALEHVEAGTPDVARRWALTALAEFDALGLPADRSKTVIVLGRAALAAKDWPAAFESSETALSIIEVSGVEDYLTDALRLRALAAKEIADASKDPLERERAVEAIERSLAHRRQVDGPGTHDATLLAHLADQRIALGQFADALRAQDELVEHRLGTSGPDTNTSLRARLIRARLRRDTGEDAAALEEIDDILAILQSMGAAAGDGLTAEVWLTRAVLCERRGDVESAIAALRRRRDAIARRGSDIAVVRAREIIVQTYRGADRTAEALAEQNLLVAELRPLVDDDDPILGEAFERRNALEWQQCRNEVASMDETEVHAAIARLRRFLAERSSGGSSDLYRGFVCALYLGPRLSQSGRHDEGIATLRAAAEGAGSAGAEYEELSRACLDELAKAQHRAGEHRRELETLEALRSAEVVALGEDHREVIGSLERLAHAHACIGDSAEAARLARLALKRSSALFGDDDALSAHIRTSVTPLIPSAPEH